MASGDSRIEGDMDELFARSCALSPPTSSKKLSSDKLWQGQIASCHCVAIRLQKML